MHLNDWLLRGFVRGERLSRTRAWCASVVLALAVWGAPAQAGGEVVQTANFSYSIAPVPGFVERLAVAAGAASPAGQGGHARIALIDFQVSLLGPEPLEYQRMVVRPLDSVAVQKLSQVMIPFSPDYQKLLLHGIRVTRAGKTIDLTREVKLDLLRREQNLENQVYEGRVTAVGILPDIRVGDAVELEYTISGINPIFGNRFSELFPLTREEPIDEFGFRLVHGEKRGIQVRVPAWAGSVAESASGGVLTRSLRLHSVKPVFDDQDRPSWADPGSRIEISEFRDWAEVEAWANQVFQVRGALAPGLEQLVSGWNQAGWPRSRQVAEILRWVQGEVRYFGIEIGVNSHQPAHPNTTFERRYGDCKDKSLLLATLLKAVGVEAEVGLVSVARNRGVSKLLPAPIAFDHAIVRAVVDGRGYWLDPTLPPQFGDLERIGAHDYGLALVLGGEPGKLENAGYPPGYLRQVVALDRYEVKSFREPVILTQQSVLKGAGAERMRWIHSQLQKDEFSRFMMADTQRQLPMATALGDLEVVDDRENNQLTLLARYQLPDLFKYSPGKLHVEVLALPMMEALKLPDIPQRSTPYALPYPLEVRHTIQFDLPENPIREVPAPNSERFGYWQLKTTYLSDPKGIKRESLLSSTKDHVPAREMQSYIEDTKQLRQKAGMQMNLTVAELPTTVREILSRTLGRFDRYGKSKSDALNGQVSSHIMVYQIGYDIGSGKLTDKQLASAHEELALHWDDIEEPEAALGEIDKALKLEPENVAFMLDKARILSGMGEFASAARLFEQVEGSGHAQDMKTTDRKAQGLTYFYLGRLKEASAILEQAANGDDPTSGIYAGFWQHIVALNSQGKVSSNLPDKMRTLPGEEWPHAIGEMLLGNISADQLIDRAASEDKGIQRDQRCEAYFYIAQKHLAEGKREEARDYFEKVLDLKVSNFIEYHFAHLEMKRLGPKKGLFNWLGGH